MKSSCVSAACALIIGLAIVVDGMVLTQDAQTVALTDSTGKEAPAWKRIAVLLRGETFRQEYVRDHARHRHACIERAKPAQMTCTNNVVNNIIKPLEQRNNTVQVFFTTDLSHRARIPALHKGGVANESGFSSCELDDLVVQALQGNSNRVVKKTGYETSGQADSVLKSVAFFNEECGGADNVKTKFDYMIFLRNDVNFLVPIDTISFDASKLNVLTRCEPGAAKSTGGINCVHDIFWMMPTELYGAFSSTIGHHGCFDRRTDPLGNGHSCQLPLREALNASGHADAFGWLEPQRRRLHKRSRIANLVIAYR